MERHKYTSDVDPYGKTNSAAIAHLSERGSSCERLPIASWIHGHGTSDRKVKKTLTNRVIFLRIFQFLLPASHLISSPDHQFTTALI